MGVQQQVGAALDYKVVGVFGFIFMFHFFLLCLCSRLTNGVCFGHEH
jgi:hypothetical protein